MAKKSIDRTMFEVKEYECSVHMFDGRTIIGKINISPMGRLSDVFTQGQSPFVVVYEATIGDGPSNRTFILNKSGISWVEPEEPVEASEEEPVEASEEEPVEASEEEPVEAKDRQT